jgi:mono/diheme cytochrome c family protein
MKQLIAIFSFLILVIAVISCQNPQQIEFNRYYSAGAAVYQTHCQNCHGDKGQGLAALIPPLTDSVYLKTNKTELACYLQNGLKGKIVVGEQTFEGQMPASDLTPIEIAQVLTYVTNSFGNKGALINNDEVQKDLTNCR